MIEDFAGGQQVTVLINREIECEINLIGCTTLLTRCMLSAIFTIRSVILPVDRA
jgi:hypothetical protein